MMSSVQGAFLSEYLRFYSSGALENEHQSLARKKFSIVSASIGIFAVNFFRKIESHNEIQRRIFDCSFVARRFHEVRFIDNIQFI